MEMEMENNFEMESQEDLNQQLKCIASIESGSMNGEGNDKILDIVEKQIKELGFTTKRLPHKDPSKAGKMLVGELLGEIKDKFFSFISHSDTVIVSEEFTEYTEDEHGEYGYGPGVIDCKGGVVISVAVLKAFLQSHKPKYSFRFIVSPTEEIGSPDFHDQIVEYGKDTVMTLGFEPGFFDGDITHGRCGNRWYKITCHGKKVHSGREYSKGINAARALAHKIINLSALTDFEKGTTVCITNATCGDGNYNTMPGVGYIYVDSRFSTPEEDKRLEKDFIDELNKVDVYSHGEHQPAKMSYEIIDYSPPITKDAVSESLIGKIIDFIGQAENRKISSKLSHGSADCNSIWQKGQVFIGGLGATGDGMHTVNEKIILSSLRTRAIGVANFLIYANENFDKEVAGS